MEYRFYKHLKHARIYRKQFRLKWTYIEIVYKKHYMNVHILSILV